MQSGGDWPPLRIGQDDALAESEALEKEGLDRNDARRGRASTVLRPQRSRGEAARRRAACVAAGAGTSPSIDDSEGVECDVEGVSRVNRGRARGPATRDQRPDHQATGPTNLRGRSKSLDILTGRSVASWPANAVTQPPMRYRPRLGADIITASNRVHTFPTVSSGPRPTGRPLCSM